VGKPITARRGRRRRPGRLGPFIALCVALLAALAIANAAALAQKADGEQVAEVKISGLVNLDEKAVRDIIDISPGDSFSLERVDIAVERLRKWGIFDAIDVYPSASPEGIVLVFNLEEATVVASIDITGNYPYIETKVRKYFTLHAGDIYTPDSVQEQVDRIKEFYLRQGYVGTEVYVEEERRPDENQLVLTFHIRHGDLLRYRKIAVEGNHAYPRGRFASVVNPLKPFSEQRLRQSLRDLKELYQNHGYPRAKITVKDKHIDFEALRIDLTLAVNEGPHVAAIFTGQHRVSGRRLKKTITIFKEGSIDQYEIESSEDAIKALLRSRGYPDAQVSSKQSERPDGTIVIAFNVDEGPAQQIRVLKFEGNRDVGSKELRTNITNREMSFSRNGAYFPEAVQDDDEQMTAVLRRKGFLEGRVGEWDVKPSKQGFALDVAVPIEQGPQTIVGAVDFAGNDSFDKKKLLDALKIRPGKPLDEPGLPDDRERLVKFYADHGHPYATAQQGWEHDDNGRAVIRYNISEGPLVRVGDILIVGDVLTSQKAIKRAMDIKEGDPFSYKKIVDSQLNIRRLGPFDLVSIETIGISERKETVHLKVKVEEQRPFLIDMGLTYSTDNSMTGTLAFSNINAFGWAKTNSLKLTAGRKLSRAEVAWLDPRFVGSSVEMATSAWIQYQQQPAYTYMQMAGAIGWAKRYSQLGFNVRWELDRNYFVEGDSTAADADSLRDSTISRVALFASYDRRDNFSEPTKGYFTAAGVDIYDEIKGQQANFAKFSWQFEYDQKLIRLVIFSSALRFDRIEDIGHNVSVPTNELLFLGGDNTIRGYDYDSLGPLDANGKATGGRLRWIVNEELRVRLFKHFGGVIFFDMGSLTNNFSEINGFSIRKSIGVGLRYLTPVGPIRLEYGFKLFNRTGEPMGKLHFTFGYVF